MTICNNKSTSLDRIDDYRDIAVVHQLFLDCTGCGTSERFPSIAKCYQLLFHSR